MKKTNKYTSLYMSTGMALGLVFGMPTYGVMFDNIGIGMCLGISIGMCLGMGVGKAKDKKINKQLEEFGYTVKAINKTEDGYDVIVSDKSGGESVVPIGEKRQRTENFQPGDFVYLASGSIEQAYTR